MRTLDEVIKAWLICFSDNSRSNCTGCPYADEDGESACFNHDREDALYYLKMYRSDMQMYSENQKYWEDELKQKIKDFGDAKERYIKRLKKLDIGTLNEPLTWDELRTMEGKPVWIEDGLENGEWYIIECFTESGRFIAHDRYADDTVFKAIDMGNMWQAFRKERSCT